MSCDTELLRALPLAVYTTDAEGRLTFYNDAAAEFWGRRPELGTTRWCGSWRLYWPDGRPMPPDECVLATALREGRAIHGVEAVVERPDGTRLPFVTHVGVSKDATGRITGAINALVVAATSQHTVIELARLAAIVSSSNDAIISKSLDGRILTWNAGATRMFGYEPDEMIGQPLTRIIPAELHGEEMDILARIRRGERLDHFDTVRITKDGRRLDISLSVSPLLDATGQVVGASNVSRDITERKENEEVQRLLIDELNHRIRNTLTVIQAIASQSLRKSKRPEDFVDNFVGRIHALARAHDLLVQGRMKGTDLIALVSDQVVFDGDAGRVSFSGPRVRLSPETSVHLGLVLHELATNARKYGGLSRPDGSLTIEWTVDMAPERMLSLTWRETGVPGLAAPASRGFGTTLVEQSLQASGGSVDLRYGADGVCCDIRLPLPEQAPSARDGPAADAGGSAYSSPGHAAETGPLSGARILVVEDEPLIALEVADHLASAGADIVGPAGTIEDARRLVAKSAFDAALLDANLAGRSVHEVAADLTMKGVPFAFVSGYGRQALPSAFKEAPLLAKPFGARQLVATVVMLLGEADRSANVVPIDAATRPGSTRTSE